MPPGTTYLPVASITVSTDVVRSDPRSVEPGARTAAMVSPSTSTSASDRPVAVTTVPPVMSVVVMAVPSWLRDRGVGVRAPVAIELPVVAHLANHVHVEVADHDLLLVAAAVAADHIALRIDELAAAVERHGQVAVLVVLRADPVGGGDEVAVGARRGGLLDLPQAVGQARLGGIGVEHDLGAVETELAPAFGEVAVVTDVDADRSDRSLEDGIAEIARAEVELLPELVEV